MVKEEEEDDAFEDSLATISFQPAIPSVSPLESEVSDSDDESRSSLFTPLRLQKIPPMPQLPPMLPPAKTEPLAPRFTSHEQMKKQSIKGGDVLFFEGKPFRYLEHLDSLPPPPPSIVRQPPKPKAMAPQAFFPRDSLQSLMRVDPQVLMGAAFNIRHALP